MQGIFALDDVEVVEEGAVEVAGLGTHAGIGADQVAGLDFGDELLQGAGEGGFAQRSMDLGVSGFPEFAGERPEAGPGEGLREVAQVDVAPAVSFSGEGEHGVGPGFDAASDHAGEVYAEKGEGGIWHGVDEVAHEMLLFGDEVVVFAAKGDYSQGQVGLAFDGEAIGVQSCAGADFVGEIAVGIGCDGVALDGAHGFTELDLPAAFSDLGAESLGESRVVDDAGFGHMEGADAGGMGFVFGDLLFFQPANSFESVGEASFVQGLEAWQLFGFGGDDDLAAYFVRYVLGTAKFQKESVSFSAIEGFERARLIVDAGVDDAAVASGLVFGKAVLLFDEQESGGRGLLEDLVGGGKPDDSSAYDCDVVWEHFEGFVSGE